MKLAALAVDYDGTIATEGLLRSRSPRGSHVQTLEKRAGTEDAHDVATDIAQAIRARYETAADSRGLISIGQMS